MLQRDNFGNVVSFNACDLTQKRDSFSFSLINAKNFNSIDPGITVNEANFSTEFNVKCDSAGGRGYSARI